MNYGFVKVAAAVPLVQVADCFYNIEKIEGLMRQASEKGVQIIAFPELSVTGYTCLDLFAQQTLLDGAEAALLQLVSNTADLDILTIVGVPLRTENRLINAAVVFQKGAIRGVVPKTYLPNYKEFQEQRWFTSATELRESTISIGKEEYPMGSHLLFRSGRLTAGIEICEDLWVPVPPQFPADDGRSQHHLQPLRQQRADRQARLPAFADLPAIRPLHGRLCLCLFRLRRIEHRPRLCR